MVEEEHLDLLQNIEWAITTESRRDVSVLDADARDAVAALVRHYEAELESRELGATRLSPRGERIFESVRGICEWRLGRASAVTGAIVMGAEDAKSVDDVVACLKKIRKSIDFWTKEGGRQGYLHYIAAFIPG